MTRKPQPAPRTQAELARALGVSRQAVHRWIAAGLTAPRRGRAWNVDAVRAWRAERAAARREYGNVDLEAAVGQVERVARRDPELFAVAAHDFDRRVRAGENPVAILREAKAKFRFYKAVEQEVRALLASGALVRREAVDERVVGLCAMFRRLVLQIPARVDAEVAAATSPTEVRRIVDAEFERMVEDLAAAARVDLDAVRGRVAGATARPAHRRARDAE